MFETLELRQLEKEQFLIKKSNDTYFYCIPI